MTKKMAVKNVRILGGSKTNNNDSKMAVFETKIQTKKQDSPRLWNKKVFIFKDCIKKSIEKQGILTILYFYFGKIN